MYDFRSIFLSLELPFNSNCSTFDALMTSDSRMTGSYNYDLHTEIIDWYTILLFRYIKIFFGLTIHKSFACRYFSIVQYLPSSFLLRRKNWIYKTFNQTQYIKTLILFTCITDHKQISKFIQDKSGSPYLLTVKHHLHGKFKKFRMRKEKLQE